jgi:hypothetical protein
MGLFNSIVLDWAIGIVFVYLLLAIICTTINEWIAGATKVRSKTLEKAIAQLLDNQPSGTAPGAVDSFLRQFYAHPLITGMMAPNRTGAAAHPTYLEARTFATTVMDLATPGKPGTITFADLADGIGHLPNGDVRTALLALIQNAAGNLDIAQKNIEQWFDDTMERTSGWYKRRTELVTVLVAVLLTVGTNADTVRIGRILWTHPTMRALMVEEAKSHQQQITSTDKDNPRDEASRDDLDKLSLLLGWSGENLKDWPAWPSRLLGWFLTATAISLGAPFWFDLLNKFMNLRNAGKKPAGNAGKQDPKPQPAPG